MPSSINSLASPNDLISRNLIINESADYASRQANLDIPNLDEIDKLAKITNTTVWEPTE